MLITGMGSLPRHHSLTIQCTPPDERILQVDGTNPALATYGAILCCRPTMSRVRRPIYITGEKFQYRAVSHCVGCAGLQGDLARMIRGCALDGWRVSQATKSYRSFAGR